MNRRETFATGLAYAMLAGAWERPGLLERCFQASLLSGQWMRRVVGDEMGVKAAGGVKDLDALKAMVAAGATRIGASAGVRIVQESKGGPKGPAGSGY